MSHSDPAAGPESGSSRDSVSPSPNSRRTKIEEMLKKDPDDIFLRYSLAMEFASEGDNAAALGIYEALCGEEPPYVPAFFRSAQLLAADEQIDQAREFLRVGIETARLQGDLHAAGEMSEMLSDLGQMGE